MKKLKNFLIKIAIKYYSDMMSLCVDNVTFTRVTCGEDSKECKRWVKKYERYSEKYKLLTEK